MMSDIFDWAFHWILLWLAFELGRRWNEKDVAASIAALTETQSKRRSLEVTETPIKVTCPLIEVDGFRNEEVHGEPRRRMDRLLL
jgi:hypothetical protein